LILREKAPLSAPLQHFRDGSEADTWRLQPAEMESLNRSRCVRARSKRVRRTHRLG
jgi:hypothetical protein